MKALVESWVSWKDNTWKVAALVSFLTTPIAAKERAEHFDREPGWEGRNNRTENPKPRPIRQDFGYSRTANAGGQAGEIGGLITAAAEAAYYGKRLEPKTLADPLTASGRLVCKGGKFHVLLGFFNADTVNEWRTPNTIVATDGRSGRLVADFMGSRDEGGVTGCGGRGGNSLESFGQESLDGPTRAFR
jgi:hypothetical protein